MEKEEFTEIQSTLQDLLDLTRPPAMKGGRGAGLVGETCPETSRPMLV